MKKLIILQSGGGELANQLWNYMSIYAYSKEIGAPITNHSFFEYGSNFDIQKPGFLNLLLYKPFKNHKKRRNSFKRQLWRNFYKIYILFVRVFKKENIISSTNSKNEVFYLPPSSEDKSGLEKDKLYFEGWLFRNPVGIEKYREEILGYFRPIQSIETKISNFLKNHSGKHMVGVHIRQGDYRTFKNGQFFIEQNRIREILNQYLGVIKKAPNEVTFIITSDGQIDETEFKGLQYEISKMGPVEDLFLLSKMTAVLGSDSSFGNFAAYYGNIPHIIFKNEEIDWEYYKNKNLYFPNKYCTLVHY